MEGAHRHNNIPGILVCWASCNISPSILLRRRIVEDHLCEFRYNKLTTLQTFCFRQMLQRICPSCGLCNASGCLLKSRVETGSLTSVRESRIRMRGASLHSHTTWRRISWLRVIYLCHTYTRPGLQNCFFPFMFS